MFFPFTFLWFISSLQSLCLGRKVGCPLKIYWGKCYLKVEPSQRHGLLCYKELVLGFWKASKIQNSRLRLRRFQRGEVLDPLGREVALLKQRLRNEFQKKTINCSQFSPLVITLSMNEGMRVVWRKCT